MAVQLQQKTAPTAANSPIKALIIRRNGKKGKSAQD
jgi:hypothetical protein